MVVAREHAYAERIAKAVLDVAYSNKAKKVKNIEIGVGTLSGVDIPTMARLVSELLMGSVAEGAYVTTVSSPASIVCGICQYSGTPETTGCGKEALASCPKCRKKAVTVHGGTEIGIRRIELEFGKKNQKARNPKMKEPTASTRRSRKTRKLKTVTRKTIRRKRK